MNLLGNIEFGCELGLSNECLEILDPSLMVLEADSPGVLSISVLLLGATKLGAKIGSEFNLFIKGGLQLTIFYKRILLQESRIVNRGLD